jgi:threonyl-tRNA synthetase
VQAKILPLSDKFVDYARTVAQTLRANGLRVTVDDSDQRLGYKVRLAETERVPYALVVGAKEAEAGTVGVRKRIEGDLGAIPVGAFIDRVKNEVASRT